MKNILHCGDCRIVLKKMIAKKQKVDLIYLDPPFNSNRIYNLVFRRDWKAGKKGKAAQQKVFEDMWDYTNQTEQMMLDFRVMLDKAEISPSVRSFLKAWIEPLSTGTRKERKLVAYLVYMTERLILMKGVLKDPGTIYYHCDSHAGHYIKIIMDGIFGRDNFKNEIVWCYSGGGIPKRDYPRKHDTIFRYTKGKGYTFNVEYKPYKENTQEVGKHSTLSGGKPINLKRGTPVTDWWTDIKTVTGWSRENTGYKTQKPIPLLKRIIAASCPSRGVVLDPFCGCGTSCIAAHALKKKWIGIDISYYAIREVKRRLKEEVGAEEKQSYELIRGIPKDFQSYLALNPYEKQDKLIQMVGGSPNLKKSGDGGVDGVLTIHLGIDEQGNDRWGEVVFSVKTGQAGTPNDVRALKGMLVDLRGGGGGRYAIGCLIIEKDITDGLQDEAERARQLKYVIKKNYPASYYDRVQILTAADIIINQERFNLPFSADDFQKLRNFERRQQQNLIYD